MYLLHFKMENFYDDYMHILSRLFPITSARIGSFSHILTGFKYNLKYVGIYRMKVSMCKQATTATQYIGQNYSVIIFLSWKSPQSCMYAYQTPDQTYQTKRNIKNLPSATPYQEISGKMSECKKIAMKTLSKKKKTCMLRDFKNCIFRHSCIKLEHIT